MKKTILLIAALMMAVSFSGIALAKEMKGEITAIDGGKVTVEMKKKDASKLSVGDKVEVEVKEKGKKKKAPAAGDDMLQGC